MTRKPIDGGKYLYTANELGDPPRNIKTNNNMKKVSTFALIIGVLTAVFGYFIDPQFIADNSNYSFEQAKNISFWAGLGGVIVASVSGLYLAKQATRNE